MARRRRLTKKRRQRQLALRVFFGIVCIAAAAFALYSVWQRRSEPHETAAGQTAEPQTEIPRPDLLVDLLSINEYSRPGIALGQVNGVVIHYTGNPGSTALANRNYFEGLKESHVTKASSHFIIDLDGTIVQCIPCSEISYASNERNTDTISIECCIADDSGKFSQATYDAAVHLTAWLLERYGLQKDAVIRHYDVTGKECPKYYVRHADAWTQFQADVWAFYKKYVVND